MTNEESQNYQQPESRYDAGKQERPYAGPKKMKDLGNLLDGIEDLVHKGNLAENYKQQGGQ